LIIADEHRPGKISAGILIAVVLKEMGYKLKLFMGNIDEASMRALQVLCNQPVTLLDPTLCDGRANLRWLFQNVASPDCMNLILTNLGSKWSEDSAFRIPRECLKLAEYLECELMPILYSDTSSTITVRAVTEIIRQFENKQLYNIHSIMFKSVLNNREFELLDREIGRQTSAVTIGSIPKRLERDQPLVTDLCAAGSTQAALPIRSSAMQLKSLEHMVKWALFNALSKTNQEWKPQVKLCDPISDAGRVNIAVVRYPSLTLGGDGTEHLMRTLGCNVVDVPLDGVVSHSVPIHGVYIPHGLAYTGIDKFFGNLYLKTMLKRGATGNSFLLAEGGSTPMLGSGITLPPTFGEDRERRGFSILPYDAVYNASVFGAPQRAMAVSRTANPFISGSQEVVWGYFSPNLSLFPHAPDDECWELKESFDGKLINLDAWCKGRILASRMRLEPWSAPESFRRWLEG
jgi:hypothetical protein